MSDMRKSTALRAFLFVVIVGAIWFAVACLNTVIDALPIWYSSSGPRHFIEGVFFLGAVSSKVWGWLSRRVWIGSQAPQSGGAE